MSHSTAHRLARAVAAAGLLSMSTGVAVLTTAPVANAADVCPNDWTLNQVSPGGDQKTFTYTAPAGKVITAYCFKAGEDRTLVEGVSLPSVTFTGIHGLSHYSIKLADAPPPEETTTAPTFTDPVCDQSTWTATQPSMTVPGDTTGIDYQVTGTATPGGQVTVNAVAKGNYVLKGQTSWSHTFDVVDMSTCKKPEDPKTPTEDPCISAASKANCQVVDPPVKPVVKKKPVVAAPKATAVVTPTVIKAGVVTELPASSAAETAQVVGTGLVGAGLALLLGSGATWLRRPGGAA